MTKAWRGLERLAEAREILEGVGEAWKALERLGGAWRGLEKLGRGLEGRPHLAAPPSRLLSILLDGPLAWTFWILGRPPRSWSTPLVEKTLLALGWLTPLGSL